MDNMLRKALWEILRPLMQLIQNLLNPEIGEKWTREFKKFLRGEPCWVDNWPKPPCLRLLSEDVITLKETDGTQVIEDAEDVFAECYFSDSGKWKLKGLQAPAPSVDVRIHRLAQNGRFTKIYGDLGENLDAMCLSQGQIIQFCSTYKKWPRYGGGDTFFLFKVGNDFFVAGVDLNPKGKLHVTFFRLVNGVVRNAGQGHRFVLPSSF